MKNISVVLATALISLVLSAPAMATDLCGVKTKSIIEQVNIVASLSQSDARYCAGVYAALAENLDAVRNAIAHKLARDIHNPYLVTLLFMVDDAYIYNLSLSESLALRIGKNRH